MLKKVELLGAKTLKGLLFLVNIKVGENLLETIHNLIDLTQQTSFKYEHLLIFASENEHNPHVTINVEKEFDDIMFEAYDIYVHLKENLKDSHREYQNIEALDVLFDFFKDFETLLTTSKFTKPATRSIQKQYFQELLNREIEKENYEYCAEIKNNMNTI